MDMIKLEQVLPAQIEARSFAIIREELRAQGRELEEDLAPVILRAIHTTADFDYADNLAFSPGAVERGREALRRGAVIVTDTNMALSGNNKTALKKLGCEAVCFMADEEVARLAKEQGSTRAVASMEKAARLYGRSTAAAAKAPLQTGEPPALAQEPMAAITKSPLQAGNPLASAQKPSAAAPNPSPRPTIFAIGNAPTALIRLYELIKEHKISPSLVIGAPVGFVNVVQSKELLMTLPDTPYIAARGRKGGSTVAAAICNALLYLESGRRL